MRDPATGKLKWCCCPPDDEAVKCTECAADPFGDIAIVTLDGYTLPDCERNYRFGPNFPFIIDHLAGSYTLPLVGAATQTCGFNRTYRVDTGKVMKVYRLVDGSEPGAPCGPDNFVYSMPVILEVQVSQNRDPFAAGLDHVHRRVVSLSASCGIDADPFHFGATLFVPYYASVDCPPSFGAGFSVSFDNHDHGGEWDSDWWPILPTSYGTSTVTIP